MKLKVINELLDNQIIKNTVSHAYIFFGRKGTPTYKTSLEFAKKLTNCKDPLNSVNVLILDKEKIAKEDVVSILSEFSKTSMTRSKRVLIINNSEIMNISTQNSLLKFIEEPPTDTHVILVTSEVDKLLSTIQSRCFLLSFSSEVKEEFDQEFGSLSNLLYHITSDVEYAKNLVADESFNKLLELANLYYKDRANAHFYNYQNSILNKENILLFIEMLLYYSIKTNVDVKKIEMFESCKEKIKYNVNTDLVIDLLFIQN